MNIHYSIHYRVSLNTRFTSKGEASEVHILFVLLVYVGKCLASVCAGATSRRMKN
jgi:hypothetical protein